MNKINLTRGGLEGLFNYLMVICLAVFFAGFLAIVTATAAVAVCTTPNDVCELGETTVSCPDDCNIGSLPAFVDPLTIPNVLQPVSVEDDGTPTYEIILQEAKQKLHANLPETTIWGYNGTFPGPTVEAVIGRPIKVTYRNELRDTSVSGHPLRDSHYLDVNEGAHGPHIWGDLPRTVVHLHGENVMPRFDGHPEHTIIPGESAEFLYPNNQRSMTMWYHDHALGITAPNVRMGLAGFYLLRGYDRALDTILPSGEFDIPLMITRRCLNPDGSFPPSSNCGPGQGSYDLVNGKILPYLEVKRGKYRFRFLNAGSDLRPLMLKNADPMAVSPPLTITLIGTDGGLIDQPLPLTQFEMGIGERLEVVIDFSRFDADTRIHLVDDIDGKFMEFRVIDAVGHTAPLLPTQPLQDVEKIDDPVTCTRRFRLEDASGAFLIQSLDVTCQCDSGLEQLCPDPNEDTDENENFTRCPNPQNRERCGFCTDPADCPGYQRWDDLTEFPMRGTTEIWEFENAAGHSHPIHLHSVMFQVLEKRDSEGNEITKPWEKYIFEGKERYTWKDTVLIPAEKGKARIKVKFGLGYFVGKFVTHCHIFSHEDDEMMRQFQVINNPHFCNDNGICEKNEDSKSCLGDCKEVSGDICGNGLCEQGDGENAFNCPSDCAGPDARVLTMPRGKASCGDGLCEGQERVESSDSFCAMDCGGGGTGCTRAFPSVMIGPNQTIVPSGSATYSLTITNNDTTDCSPSTFTLGLVNFDPVTSDPEESNNLAAFITPSQIAPTSVTLAPGGIDRSATLTVQGSGTGLHGDVLGTSVGWQDEMGHPVSDSSLTFAVGPTMTRISPYFRERFSMSSPLSFATGSDPRGMAVADLNGDSNPDLAVANASGNTVSILLGDGTGAFPGSARSFPVGGSSPRSIVTGDFNGDGELDLATANMDSRNISVLRGNGDGTFQPAIVFPGFTLFGYPVHLTVGDFNEDGRLDLAVAESDFMDGHSPLNGGLTFLFGQDPIGGAPLFGLPDRFLIDGKWVGRDPIWVETADLNKDRHLDLTVVNRFTSDAVILLGDGLGNFSHLGPYWLGGTPRHGAIGDLDNDGNLDLAVATHFKRLLPPRGDEWVLDFVSLLRGDGTGSFSSPRFDNWIPTELSSSPNSVALRDLNLDGHPDLVVAGSDGKVSVIAGHGREPFFRGRLGLFSALGSPRGMEAVDLNRDGRADVVTVSVPGAVHVVLNTSVNFPGNANFTRYRGMIPLRGCPAGEFCFIDMPGSGLLKSSVAPGRSGSGTLDISFVDYSGELAPSLIKTGDMQGVVVSPSCSIDAVVDYFLIGDGTGEVTQRDAILTGVPAAFSVLDENTSNFQNAEEVLLHMHIRAGVPGSDYQRLMTLRIAAGGLRGTTTRVIEPDGSLKFEARFDSIAFTAENINQTVWQSYLSLNPDSCLRDPLNPDAGLLIRLP